MGGFTPWVTRFIAVVLPLYFAWELMQMPAYEPHATSWTGTITACALATLGDAVIVGTLWLFGAALFRHARWFTPPRRGRYAVVVLAGIVLNAVVEWIAVDRFGLWQYRPWHVTVPPLDVGVFPLLQPAILLPAVFWILHRWSPAP